MTQCDHRASAVNRLRRDELAATGVTAWREDAFVLSSAGDAVSAAAKPRVGFPDTHRATPNAATPAVRRLAVHPSLVRARGPGALPVSAAARRHRPAFSGCSLLL